jgi:hypothetical protein
VAKDIIIEAEIGINDDDEIFAVYYTTHSPVRIAFGVAGPFETVEDAIADIKRVAEENGGFMHGAIHDPPEMVQ